MTMRPPGRVEKTDTPRVQRARGAQRWMTAGWSTREAQRLKRLGEYVYRARAGMQTGTGEPMSLVALQNQARHDGLTISEALIRRLEAMRLGGKALDARRTISWAAVDYIVALNGQTLGDLDAYLRTGDTAALDPSLNARAESVRTVFLSLSPARQQSAEEFIEHLYQRDLAESAAESADVRALTRASSGAVDAETQHARDTLRDATNAAIRALTQEDAEDDRARDVTPGTQRRSLRDSTRRQAH